MKSKEKILQQGAEANIILHGDKIIKRRVKKSYRLPSIDENIRKLRTRAEAKLLEKAGQIIHVPQVKDVNEKTKEISMDFIKGKKLSESLDSFPLKKQKKICKILGFNIAKLHDNDIIHGDLTTSNMIYVEGKDIVNSRKNSIMLNEINISDIKTSRGLAGGNNFKVYFIDFGLGFHSHKIEDKAVDLHLLRQALEAKHFKHWKILFAEVLSGYSSSKDSKKVIEQFKKVEARGRYKEAY